MTTPVPPTLRSMFSQVPKNRYNGDLVKRQQLLVLGTLFVLLCAIAAGAVSVLYFGPATDIETAVTQDRRELPGHQRDNARNSEQPSQLSNAADVPHDQTGGQRREPDGDGFEDRQRSNESESNPSPRLSVENRVTWQVPRLSWDSAHNIGSKSGLPEANAASTDVDSPYNWPSDTLEFVIYALDAVSGERVEPFEVRIVDDHGRLRVAATVDEKKPVRRRFRINYRKDTTFLIQVIAGSRVGYAALGTSCGSPQCGDNILSYGERRFVVTVNVLVSDHRTTLKKGTLRVLDKEGSPLGGAVVYLLKQGNIIGQSDANGVISVPMPDLASATEHVQYLWSGVLVVSSPGYVPVFLRTEGVFGESATRDVILRGREFIVEFYLKLPSQVSIGPTKSSQHPTGTHDRRVFAPAEDPVQSMRDANWSLSRMQAYRRDPKWGEHGYDNTRALEAAVGQSWQEWWEYDRWYTRQWNYDPETGMWQVVLPHPCKLVLFINEEQRTYYDEATKQEYRDWMMYPGILIDATDPANPHVELIYPPN